MIYFKQLLVPGNTYSNMPKPTWLVAAFVLAAAVMSTVLMPGDTRAQDDTLVSGEFVVVPNLLNVGQTAEAVGFQLQPNDLVARIEFSDHFRPEGYSCQAPHAGVSQNSEDGWVGIILNACSAGEAILRLVVVDTGYVIGEQTATITEQAVNVRDVLVGFYNATDGPNWGNDANWLSDKPLGEWYGVTTDEEDMVIGLELSQNNLSRNIPPELGNLSSLGSLDLSGNQLDGNIPPELGNLSSLQELWLFDNQLSGEIPPKLGGLSSLVRLWLFDNQLSGEMPTQLGNLSSLGSLDLSRNQLSGEIPSELGNLFNLSGLGLRGNQLSGEIPSELGSLSNLEWLTISDNEFTGCIPAGFRDVELNDLARVELPHCDVLLNGLTLGPGLLLPQFDPYRTEYSASVGLSPVTVTVTPTNDHNAMFQFFDNNNVELSDADNSLEGFQVEFGGGVPAVTILVVSQDTLASRTYVVTDLGNRYDANGDRVIRRDEVISAIKDYFSGLITREEVIVIVKLYFS